MSAIRNLLAVMGVMVLFHGQASAVVVEIMIETEGEPVSEVEISFETAEGEPISFDLFETSDPAEEATEEEGVETSGEEMAGEPDGGPVVTDENGALQVELAEIFNDRNIVAIVKQGDEVIKRHDLKPNEDNRVQAIEVFDAADALLSLSLSQPDRRCRLGESCEFELVLENDGNGIYRGPIFVGGNLQGDWIEALSQLESVFCSGGGSGDVFCHIGTSLPPGARQSYPVNIELPDDLQSGAKNCLSLQSPAPPVGPETNALVAAVQLGLRRDGYAVSDINGIGNASTDAAIADYWRERGEATALTTEQTFESLYQSSLRKIGRLGILTSSICTNIIVSPPGDTASSPPDKPDDIADTLPGDDQGPTPKLALAKFQPKPCQTGRNCVFAVGLSNISGTDYVGPVFLADRMPVAVRSRDLDRGDWSCQPGRRGETLCSYFAEPLAANDRIGLPLLLNARSTPKPGAENCAEILWPRTDLPLGEDRPTVQILQFAANAAGFNAGPVDGVVGPQTRRAFGQLMGEERPTGRDISVEDVLLALSWDSMMEYSAVDDNAKACAPIDMTGRPRSQPKASARVPEDSEPPRRRRRVGVPEISFGLDLGLSILRDRGRKRGPRKEKRRKRRTPRLSEPKIEKFSD